MLLLQHIYVLEKESAILLILMEELFVRRH